MPSRSPHPCSSPGCPELVTAGRYCSAHKPPEVKRWDNDTRESASKRGYGSSWVKIRDRQLRLYPLCFGCGEAGYVREATVVHHIDHDQHNNKQGNLRSLCRDCHEKHHGRRRVFT